ncbi:CrcB family protein [Galactobacter sp.]|uniref:fluoride efflux transporter FluC n=1 Tax=Galactobacter sp. TaxID=2676125 RepID=UPI0025C2B784|nr:CrcB family protein [Galactobacter sp.]
MIFLCLCLAGGLGGVARYWVDSRVNSRHRSALPWGTVVVNASACLLLGLFTGLAMNHGGDWWPVLTVGFTGGYSTFSTACVEAARLSRGGHWGLAAVQALGMLVVSFGLAGLGLWLGSLV